MKQSPTRALQYNISRWSQLITRLKDTEYYPNALLSHVYSDITHTAVLMHKRSRGAMDNHYKVELIIDMLKQHWETKAFRVSKLQADNIYIKRFYNRIANIYTAAAHDLFCVGDYDEE